VANILERDGEKLYNTAIALDRMGTIVARYYSKFREY